MDLGCSHHYLEEIPTALVENCNKLTPTLSDVSRKAAVAVVHMPFPVRLTLARLATCHLRSMCPWDTADVAALPLRTGTWM